MSSKGQHFKDSYSQRLVTAILKSKRSFIEKPVGLLRGVDSRHIVDGHELNLVKPCFVRSLF